MNADGTVLQTQLHVSAFYEADRVALEAAKQLRFSPAVASGRAVAVWVVFPLNVCEVRESCSDMAVPLSAGVAAFADSTLLERPELGWQYRFEGHAELGFAHAIFDVFIYPAEGWPPPKEQAADYRALFELQRADGRIFSFRVRDDRRRQYRPERSSAVRRVLDGHELRLRSHIDSS